MSIQFLFALCILNTGKSLIIHNLLSIYYKYFKCPNLRLCSVILLTDTKVVCRSHMLGNPEEQGNLFEGDIARNSNWYINTYVMQRLNSFSLFFQRQIFDKTN